MNTEQRVPLIIKGKDLPRTPRLHSTLNCHIRRASLLEMMGKSRVPYLGRREDEEEEGAHSFRGKFLHDLSPLSPSSSLSPSLSLFISLSLSPSPSFLSPSFPRFLSCILSLRLIVPSSRQKLVSGELKIKDRLRPSASGQGREWEWEEV